MPIKLKGSSSGDITLDVPATAGTNTATIQASSGTIPVMTSVANGTIAIGNGTNTTAATLTAGSGISITNGAGSITIAASGGSQLQTRLFTSTTSWTSPAGVTRVRATVIGAGAGGYSSGCGGSGGIGGFAVGIYTVTASTAYTITVGTGGTGGSASGTSGGTSSFASFCSATGGTGAGANGAGSGGNIKNSVTAGGPSGGGNSSLRPIGYLIGAIYDSDSATASPTAFSTSSYAAAGMPGGSTGVGGMGGAVLLEWVGPET
jgi:hypothetical protein